MTLKRSCGLTVLSLLLTCLFTGLGFGCATHSPTVSALESLQGTWQGGTVGAKSDDKYTITITGNAFHFHRDTNFWFETTIALPAGTVPQQLHATIKRCAPGQENSLGKKVIAIFKIEDGILTLAARGDGAEDTPTTFDATQDSGLTRYELRRVQAQ